MEQPPSASEEAARNFLKLIKQLLQEKAYEGVKMLFRNPNEAARNLQHLPLIAMDIYEEICVPSLDDEVNVEQPELFDCANELLRLVSQYYFSLEELMLELMEKIEESSSIAVFSAYMRALQVVLQRQGDQKPQAVEWCLQSVSSRLKECPLPEFLSEGYDEAAGRLLEQNQQIEDLMAFYLTIDLFYQPLLAEILSTGAAIPTIFRYCGLTRQNAFTCFYIQLMGKPLALLQMGRVRHELTHKYVQQVVKGLTQAACSCLSDPFYLLGLVEQRARWQRKLDAEKGVYEMSSQNMFLIEEKMPLYAVGMFYHALFVGNLLPPKAPKIYQPLYLFETGLYLVSVLLEQVEPPLQHCGLRLLEHLLTNTLANSGVIVPCSSLQLDVHKRLCESLCKIVGYSPQVSLRQLGLLVLRKYVIAFDHEGKYFVLKNLIETLQHDGLLGYLASMYKDLVDQALRLTASELPLVFSGKQFREMLLLCLCVLPQDVKSDLLLHSDRICNALNILRYFALKDLSNDTGFWDFMPEIEERLLQPLGKALDFSLAHYKAYKERVENGQSSSDDALMQKQLKMLAVNISNSGMASGDGMDNNLPDIGREEKLDVLSSSITSLESLLGLYLRANECIEQSLRQRQPQQQEQVSSSSN
ncbi:glomulin [Drosophila tropicalis]|uniref:glomulin n=1 Tax=Drosophila tropicalis TaxID=46794 RepID=UPI0035AB9603